VKIATHKWNIRVAVLIGISSFIQVSAGQNLLFNFSFESPAVPDNTQVNGAPEGWEIAKLGATIFLYRPNPSGSFPPTDAQQRLTLESAILLQHTSELITPDTVYILEADTLPYTTASAHSRGNLALRLYDGDTYTVLARTEDFLNFSPPLNFQIWNRVELRWDSTNFPETWGKPLTAVLDIKPSNRYLFDNVSLTKEASAACLRVVQTDGQTCVNEAGHTDSLSVCLLQPPSETLQIRLTPDDGQINLGQGVGNPVILSFSSSDWDTPKTISVSAVEDPISQNPRLSGITISAEDPINQSQSVRVKILDKEPAAQYLYNSGFEIPSIQESAEYRYPADGWEELEWDHGYLYNPASGSIQPIEGDNRFCLYHKSRIEQKTGLQIEADTLYTLTGYIYAYLLGDGTDNTVKLLAYGNGQTPVVLAAGPNLASVLPYRQWHPISLKWNSRDYPEMAGRKISVRLSVDSQNSTNSYFFDSLSLTKTTDIKDLEFIDTETIEVSELGSTSDTYRIYLKKAPSAPVIVNLSTDSHVTVSPSEFVFTPDNYGSPQTVTVTAINDGVQENGIHTSLILHSTVSEDPDYHAIAKTVSVLVRDSNCGAWGYYSADINKDCYVDIVDLVMMANDWLRCTDIRDLNCDQPWIPQIIHPADFPILSVTQEWGVFEIDKATHSAANPANPITINGVVYEHGLGTHANSRIVLQLNGEYTAFEAEVGIQTGNTTGSVIFRIYGDGRLLYDSGPVLHAEPARSVRVSVVGIEELTLVVDDAGDGITCDASNWANATLTTAENPILNPNLHIDVAPFARVVTWNPQLTGFHPSRTQELTPQQIFSEEDVVPDAAGIYTVPAAPNGELCIGLQWYENRSIKSMQIEYAEDSVMPPADQIRLEWWVGESTWQGDWRALTGPITQTDQTLSYTVNSTDIQNALAVIAGKNTGDIQKIRWIFPSSVQPVKIKRLQARTRSFWDTATITLYSEQANPAGPALLEFYNGFIEPAQNQSPVFTQSWNLSQPLGLSVRYCISDLPPQSDRTLIRFHLPEGNFGISVDNTVNNGTVYMPDFGIFATTEPNFLPADYKEQIAGKTNILQQVRQLPDQSFPQAMEQVHRIIQNNGPTMLSLACDNDKFVVGQNGTIWRSYWPTTSTGGTSDAFRVVPVYGDGSRPLDFRYLDGDWLPIVVNEVTYGDIVYRQRAGVAPYGTFGGNTIPDWLQPNPLCAVQYDIQNTGSSSAAISMKLSLIPPSAQSVSITQVPGGYMAYYGGLLWAFIQTRNLTLSVQVEGSELTFSGTLPANTTQTFYAYIPGWDMAFTSYAQLDSQQLHFERIEEYWNRIMNNAMQIDIPDALLSNIIKASQVHIMMAARNESQGLRVSPWCASAVYGPLESEAQAVIHGMSLFGHSEFSRRSLDFFINRYNEDGLLTTGYTLWGLGWHLWTLGDDYMLYRNQTWLSQAAPKLEQACNWIVSEREKTKKYDGYGLKMPEYGLMPPGVQADWSRFAYAVRPQGEFYAGLCAVAEAFNDIQYPGSEGLLQTADEFKDEIRRAYLWTQARSLSIRLLNDSWIPYSPAFITCFGPIGDMYPGEDGGRSWGKDVSMGAHHLVPLKLLSCLDPREVEWISNYLEDVWFLMGGMSEYPEEEVKANWFNLGGFYKVQPYYCRIAELYAHNDDVKPFIRAYFNAIPTLINTENLTFWEHFHNGGAWNKTHETGWFLTQTRTMMVMEKENDELWLAPFVTDHWMQDGMTVAVQNAPTEYGPVSFEIQSVVSQNRINAQIDGSALRTQPAALVLRLRHPNQRPMTSVRVNGIPHEDFDPVQNTIRTIPSARPISVQADY
jgi:hypothetical protein